MASRVSPARDPGVRGAPIGCQLYSVQLYWTLYSSSVRRTSMIRGVAAGVPFVAAPPVPPSPTAPAVLAWHLLDPPRTEAAFAAALPLAGLDAWRIYLGLPMSGSRLPCGGFDEVMRLAADDAVLNVYGPMAEQVAGEVGDAWSDLQTQLGIGDGPVGVL